MASIVFGITLLCGITASAATFSGNCGADGDNVTWSLDTSTGILTISGSGAMKEFTSSGPWFSNQTSIKKVIINNGVTTIGMRAFCQYKNLESIVIPDSITNIGYQAFYYCSNLTSITIPNSVKTIGNFAFSNCTGLTSISLPDGVTTIGEDAFSYCRKATSITLSNSLTIIPKYAFTCCESITSITIPDSVTTIEATAFGSCIKLASITLPDSLVYIEYAFGNTAYYNNSSNWDNGVLYIDNYLIATKQDRINGNFIIKDGTKVISKTAFTGCSNLTSITIPDSVINIGSSPFWNCTALTNIMVDANNQYYTSVNGVLYDKDIETIIHYPVGKTGNCVIPRSVKSISDYAFRSCSSITDVYYDGTGDEWASVTIGSSNTPLTSANIHCIDDCDILSIISPEGGILNAAEKTITFNVANSLTSFTPEFELSYGASWNLYSTATATTAISKTVDLSREDRTYTRYIKVLAADEETVNTYTVTFCRNTKSISPVITARRDVVTITAENCKIYYTTDGSTPIAEGDGYESPCVFSSVDSKATVKAIAVEDGKDEISDVVTYEVPEYLTTTMTGIECFDNDDGTCDYMIMIKSDGVPSGKFIIAIYDIDDNLIGIKSEYKTINLEETISSNVGIIGTPYTYKAFFWNSLEDLVPLCNNAEGTVTK